MAAASSVASPRKEGSRGDTASPRSPKSADDWTVSQKISSLSYGELKAIAYRHPGLIYNPHLTEKSRLFLAMELGLQRMALDTIATLRVSPHETSDEGVSILHLTCAKGFPKILSLLQERKTDLETLSDRGETPLFVAAQAGHAEIVERLIHAGCKVNTPNSHGVSALQVAALSGHLDVVQAGGSQREEASAAMAHMLDRRGSSHRLIAHLLAASKSREQSPRIPDSLTPNPNEGLRIVDSAGPRLQSLPKSLSAEQPSAIRPRRGSIDASPDKRDKKNSGKKRLSKGTSEVIVPRSSPSLDNEPPRSSSPMKGRDSHGKEKRPP